MTLFDQLNTAENSNEAVTNEKHLPLITVEKLSPEKIKVKVDVGGGKHPNADDHWIQWVELQINGLFIARSEFSAVISDPTAEFIINANRACKIGALARCNKHGLWKSEIDFA
ncbi:MAG: desulfoferrodoxin [Deltaproteobacteria bacterium]|jgi:superoxide reductase|nr:desulfoferrodoxin [Deltaproteobacteria bacterium]MBT4527229.1 desulfoferrodoxin [Deltaproteobacteria bacterium]